MTTTCAREFSPSISVSNCATKRFSASPWTWLRLGAIESISSMKMIAGDDLAASSNTPRSAFSLAIAVQNLAWGIGQPLFGALAERWGDRPAIILGALLYSLGLVMTALVTTPAGDPVAMVHCNNGASELQAWANLFGEFAAALGAEASSEKVFATLFGVSLTRAGEAGKPVLAFFEAVAKVMFKYTDMVMRLTPIGVFGAMTAVHLAYFGVMSVLGIAFCTVRLRALFLR